MQEIRKKTQGNTQATIKMNKFKKKLRKYTENSKWCCKNIGLFHIFTLWVPHGDFKMFFTSVFS